MRGGYLTRRKELQVRLGLIASQSQGEGLVKGWGRGRCGGRWLCRALARDKRLHRLGGVGEDISDGVEVLERVGVGPDRVHPCLHVLDGSRHLLRLAHQHHVALVHVLPQRHHRVGDGVQHLLQLALHDRLHHGPDARLGRGAHHRGHRTAHL